MEKPNLYKKISYKTVKNRPVSQAENKETQKIQTVINKFFELFKNKHL